MAAPDWLASTEYIVAANHPDGLPDTKNRAGQTINTMMLVEHDANGRHSAQNYALVGEIDTYTGNGTEPRTLSLTNTTLTPLLAIVWSDDAHRPLEKLSTVDNDDAFERGVATKLDGYLTFATGSLTLGANASDYNTNTQTFYYLVLGIDTSATYTGDAGAGSNPTWITSSTSNLMIADDSAVVSSGNIGNNIESTIWTIFTHEHATDGTHDTDPYAAFGMVAYGEFTPTGSAQTVTYNNADLTADILFIWYGDVAGGAGLTTTTDTTTTKKENAAAFIDCGVDISSQGEFEITLTADAEEAHYLAFDIKT